MFYLPKSKLLHAFEPQTLTAESQKRIQTFDRCYCILLNISFKYHVTNEDVRRRIQGAIGEYHDQETKNGLATTQGFRVLQNMVKWQRKTLRQKKEQEDNIEENKCIYFANTAKAAEIRTRQKRIVVKSSVVLTSLQGCWIVQTSKGIPNIGQLYGSKLKCFPHMLLCLSVGM